MPKKFHMKGFFYSIQILGTHPLSSIDLHNFDQAFYFFFSLPLLSPQKKVERIEFIWLITLLGTECIAKVWVTMLESICSIRTSVLPPCDSSFSFQLATLFMTFCISESWIRAVDLPRFKGAHKYLVGNEPSTKLVNCRSPCLREVEILFDKKMIDLSLLIVSPNHSS